MKRVFLKMDRQERFNMRRGWFVNAFRIVNEKGDDLVQPWFNSLGDLRKFIKTHNEGLSEDLKWVLDNSEKKGEKK